MVWMLALSFNFAFHKKMRSCIKKIETAGDLYDRKPEEESVML
jgi:hypothetical protein